jgi:hypothetical protein
MAETPPPLPLSQRLWLILTQATLLLPFVTARDCANGQLTDYSGLELYAHQGGVAAFVPLFVVTVLLLVFPYRGAPVGRALVSLGLHAYGATVALMVALAGPSFAMMFDELTYHAGWFLHVGGWGALAAAFLGGAVLVLARGGGALPRGRLAVAVIALLAAPPVATFVKLLHDEPPPSEALLGFASGVLLVVPLVLAGFGLARQQADEVPLTSLRWAWWGLVGLTLLLHLSAAIAD